MKKHFCDMCGKITNRAEKYSNTKFKVKSSIGGKWKRMDICPNCQDKIKDYCKREEDDMK